MKIFNNDVVAITYLNNTLKNKKLSHAYLFISEDKQYVEKFIISFTKTILCEKNKNNEFYYCDSCTTCNNINKNSYVDFIIIDTDNGSVKKEDILFLKNEFKTKAFFEKKIYWIKNIENMTQVAANSILKFLEEPEDNTIAILSCSNTNMVLPTIISRCQQIKLVGGSSEFQSNNLEIITLINKFLEEFYKNKHMSVLNILENIKEKEHIIFFLNYLLKIIKDSYFEVAEDNEIYNIAMVQEQILTALKDINSNVSGVLVLEKFLFSLIINNNDLKFISKEKNK